MQRFQGLGVFKRHDHKGGYHFLFAHLHKVFSVPVLFVVEWRKRNQHVIPN